MELSITYPAFSLVSYLLLGDNTSGDEVDFSDSVG